MEGVPTSERMALRGRDGAWLGLALTAHLALLAIPVGQRFATTDAPLAVSVSLLRPSPPRVSSPPVKLSVPDPVQVEGRKRSPEKPARAPAPSADAAEVVAPTAPNAAALLESARALISAPEVKAPRALGKFEPPPPPANWRPSITVEENLFGESYLPSKTEVVDRWLAADGSHNVVVRTPNGMTLCGRAQPWNPMQPLVEHVMMFRPCGGGGKRTFEMPERFLRNARAR